MIDKNKRYRYRNGKEIIGMIFDVPSKYRGSIIVTVSQDGDICQHTSEGKAFADSSFVWDLVEISPYDDIQIGDAVVVRGKIYGTEIRDHMRVFAGVNENGLPETFDIFANGEFVRLVSDNCRKATEDDFK